jgi:hypothetical protein
MDGAIRAVVAASVRKRERMMVGGALAAVAVAVLAVAAAASVREQERMTGGGAIAAAVLARKWERMIIWAITAAEAAAAEAAEAAEAAVVVEAVR